MPTSTPGYFQKYIILVPETDLMDAFNNQLPIASALLLGIDEEKSNYAYGVDKWTIKELLQHITDTERIFAYRALAIARGEKVNLPGFEENVYAANSHAGDQPWQNLVEEFLTVRKAIYLLFKSFGKEVLQNIGTANNNSLNVESIGFITLGHFYHHKKILEERYL